MVEGKEKNGLSLFLKDLIAGGESIIPQTSALLKCRLLGNYCKDSCCPNRTVGNQRLMISPVFLTDLRVKLLLQTQKSNTRMITSYRSGLECLGDIYRKEGFVSLWRGNAANVLRFNC
jgi:hypothetical protein